MNEFYMPMIRNPVKEFEKALEKLTAKKPSDKNLNDVISDIMYCNVTGKTEDAHTLQQILFDPAYLLSEMDMLAKWHDPDLDDDSREYLVCYIVHLNAFAKCNDLIQNKLKVPNDLKENMSDKMPTDLESMDQLGTHYAPILLPQAIECMPDLYIVICSLYGAGLKGGNLLYYMIDQYLPEQIKTSFPVKGMLDSGMAKLLAMQCDELDGMVKMIEKHPSYQKMLSGDSSILSQLDPQSLMILQLFMTQVFGSLNTGGDPSEAFSQSMQNPQLLNQMLGLASFQPQQQHLL